MRNITTPNRFGKDFPHPADSRAPSEIALQAHWRIQSAPEPTVKITKWRAGRNIAGTVRVHFSAELPSGLVINDVRLMVGPKGARFLGMPAQKAIDSEGKPLTRPDGKQIWHPFVEFRDKATSDKFRDIILTALRRVCPDEFVGEGGL